MSLDTTEARAEIAAIVEFLAEVDTTFDELEEPLTTISEALESKVVARLLREMKRLHAKLIGPTRDKLEDVITLLEMHDAEAELE